MEQKVDPDRILGLAEGMKRLNRVIEEGVMGKCADVSRLINETKNDYREFPYVRSAASEVEYLLQEIKKLARSISEELSKKESALSWTAREYKRKDAEAVKLLETMKKRVPISLNRFAPSSFGQNSNFQSLFTSLSSTEAKLTNSSEPLLTDVSLTPNNNQPQLIASNAYNTVSLEDILNRDDPDVKQKLQNTYWGKLSVEEQDRRYKEIKAEMNGINKKLADENRRVQSGIGNQFFANLFVGGSNLIVNAINTATLGAPETITEWITGPAPEGYVNPMDDPYGKMAGKLTGEVVGFMLPFKYIKALKSPALLVKLSPTVLRSVTAEAIFSSASQVSDALTDYKKDGDQSLGERLGRVAMNTALAGAGDVAFTFASNGISQVLQSTAAKKVTLEVTALKDRLLETVSTKVEKIRITLDDNAKRLLERLKLKRVVGEGTSEFKGVSGTEREIFSNEAAFDYYIKLVDGLDVTTAENTATFYSGPGNRKLAEEFAKMNEKMTLEMTNGGKYLDDLKLFEEESVLTKAQAAEVWKKLSEKYAQQASGNAYGFVKGSWEGSIFNTIEYPALEKNSEIINVFTELFANGGK